MPSIFPSAELSSSSGCELSSSFASCPSFFPESPERESLPKSEILLAATARTLPSAVRSASFFAASLSAGRSVRIIIIEVVHNIPLKICLPALFRPFRPPPGRRLRLRSSILRLCALARYLPVFLIPFLLPDIFYREYMQRGAGA